MKKTFLLFIVFTLAAVGLLALETTGKTGVPDVAAVAIEKVNVQKAEASFEAVKTVQPSLSEIERVSAGAEAITQSCDTNRSADAAIADVRETKPDIALTGRTYALRPEPIRSTFNYEPSITYQPKASFTQPDIVAFKGFGANNSARAKI